MKSSPRKMTRHQRPLAQPFASRSTASYYYIPKSLVVDDIDTSGTGLLTQSVLHAFEKDDLAQVVTLLESHLRDSSTIVEPDLVNILVKLSLSEIPYPEFSPLELQVERPYFQREMDPSVTTDTAFYNFIYNRIPFLYQICKSYEKIMFNDRDFQEYYIWLCYHQGDLATMQYLIRAYLKQNEVYDSKVLSYAAVLFLSNYETTLALSVMEEIMTFSRTATLDPILLELVLQLSIRYDSLYDNTRAFFKLWCEHQTTLSPKALALMIRITQRSISKADDSQPILAICNDLNLSTHYMIKTQQLMSSILSRSPTKPNKPITNEDIEEINSISKRLKKFEQTESLVDFYYQLIHFFGIEVKNLNMVLYILHKMKEDEVVVGEKFVKIILKFYSNSGKFMNLLEFLQFSLERLAFNKQYVVDLYEGFVKTYPYVAVEFDKKYKQWLSQESTALSSTSKSTSSIYIGPSIKPSKSTLTPLILNKPTLHPLKYNPTFWKPLSVHPESQLQLRFKQGFPDLERRGIRPDFAIIKETYQHLPPNQRHLVLDIMKRTNSHSPKKILSTIRIQTGNYNKNYLKDYIKHEGNGLSAQNRLNIALVLMNKGLGKLAIRLLETIPQEQLNDRGSMIRLQKLLRLNITTYQLRLFMRVIDEFPINEVVLSPYLFEKCCKLEELLVKRIKQTEARRESDSPAPVTTSTFITKRGRLLKIVNLLLCTMSLYSINFLELKIDYNPLLPIYKSG